MREGLSLDPTRPYRIELTATLTDDHPGLNSFAIHFAAGGTDGDGAALSAHTVNLDLAPGGGQGSMKWMGFLNGGFAQTGSTTVTGVAVNTTYTFQVDVGRDLAGSDAPGLATVTLTDTTTGIEKARFTGDWTSHPWQPPAGQPVRFGLNSHAADWTVRDLSIRYLDVP